MEPPAAFAEALVVGHKIYVGEGCWHCHSQQVRPWGNDEARYGRKSYPEEYHNKLNMPPLWGTRRIGPDLIRRGGKQSNDWHVAHFYNPPDVNPVSVMPSYPWFYEDDGLTPNKKGLSIIAYVQWLGSWEESADETIYGVPYMESLYPPTEVTPPRPPGFGEETEEPGAEDEGDFWGE
jgi:cbb3-type cytochrome c oxidase subunit II